MMERIDASNDITRLRNEDQYLVTLNIRSKRRARSTEKPNEPPLISVHSTSNIEPRITIQSNRLNAELK